MTQMTEEEVRDLAKTLGDKKLQVVAQALFLILDELQDINKKLKDNKEMSTYNA